MFLHITPIGMTMLNGTIYTSFSFLLFRPTVRNLKTNLVRHKIYKSVALCNFKHNSRNVVAYCSAGPTRVLRETYFIVAITRLFMSTAVLGS